MTGFGRASGAFNNKQVTVEIKSLNSKNLDLFVRLPPIYRKNEIELRKIVGSALERGKIECNIQIEQNEGSKTQKINTDILKSYHKTLSELAAELGVGTQNILGTLMKMPDVFSQDEEELDEEEWNFVLSILQEAIDNHLSFRAEEGQQLADEFSLRIGNIRHAFDQVPSFEKERVASIKMRIESNLDEHIGQAKVDKNRFEQELIYYIEKFDISEETLRLENHLNYFLQTIADGGAQGKKLGFISQEIGREINTLGSKSYHSDMQKLVVEMKDELEKIKEQVLNTL
jgi:uncharacterized protein (TIGR00255 family)